VKKIKKVWRKLPIEKRLRIPINYFNLDELEILKIRKIIDPKEKLIQSAKLQFETFGDIHTDLTSWIAGYASDATVREKFGSSLKLREIFIKSKITNKKIKPSWADIKRNVILPTEITKNLAEETGIHLGDGNLNINTDKFGWKRYGYNITGNLAEEIIYYSKHILPLIKSLYNLEGRLLFNKDKNSITADYKSKAIVEYKNKILKLPIGKKTYAQIPKEIMKDKELQKRVIIGLVDTDFSLINSMNLNLKLTSINVINQISKILKNNKINFNIKFYDNNKLGGIYINQRNSLKILEDWKLNNIKHISKYEVWKEFKKYFPYSHTEERLALLKGIIDIEHLNKICNKRKKASEKVETASR